MRVLVCGSRHYGNDYDSRIHIYKVLSEYVDDIDVVIQGEARGVDTQAKIWAGLFNKACLSFPAGWEKHGKAAGPIRNKQMLDEGKPDLVIAFLAPNSRGTKNMIDQATKAGVPVKIVEIADGNSQATVS
jgi:hypothetical protein